jgi:predicted phosphodiesterase
MKLAIWSDLHLNFYSNPEGVLQKLQSIDFDLFICAGDITTITASFNPFNWLNENKIRTLYVPGNHDYYHSSLSYGNNYYKIMNYEYVTILNNSSKVIDGIKFSGTPLWFQGEENPYLNDFNYIKGFSDYIVRENKKCLKFIKNECLDSDVIVTHHIPHKDLITPRFRGMDFNKYFCCYACEKYSSSTLAKLWVFGHTHDKVDSVINKTRFVCNPLAYPSEEQNEVKIIEI